MCCSCIMMLENQEHIRKKPVKFKASDYGEIGSETDHLKRSVSHSPSNSIGCPSCFVSATNKQRSVIRCELSRRFTTS